MSSIPLGSIIYVSFRPILKIYLILGAGFLLARKNVLSIDTSRNILVMVMSCTMPALIFLKVVTLLQLLDIKHIGVVCIVSCLLFTIGAACSFAVATICRVPRCVLGTTVLVGLFPNISDLPVAYIQSMSGGLVFNSSQGNKGVAYVCIFLAMQVALQFNLGGYRLQQMDFNPKYNQEPFQQEAAAETAAKAESPDTSATSDLESVEDKPAPAPLQPRPAARRNLTHISTNSANLLDCYSDRNSVSPTHDDQQQQHAAFLAAANTHHLNHVSTATSTLLARRGSIASTTASVRQLMQDLVREYSKVEGGQYDEALPVTMESGMGARDTFPPLSPSASHLLRQPTVDSVRSAALSVHTTGSSASLLQPSLMVRCLTRWGLPWLIPFIQNLCKPMAIALVVSITVAMIPWVKALFVSNWVDMPTAPDKQPPLEFIMDFATYVGAASVPLGLLLLGATLSRLEVRLLPPGYIYVLALLMVLKMMVMPVIGVLIVKGLAHANLFDDPMLRFVLTINWGLPSATALIYISAIYTDPNATSHVQMDCVAVQLMMQYPVLIVTLPTLASFTLKNQMGV